MAADFQQRLSQADPAQLQQLAARFQPEIGQMDPAEFQQRLAQNLGNLDPAQFQERRVASLRQQLLHRAAHNPHWAKQPAGHQR